MPPQAQPYGQPGYYPQAPPQVRWTECRVEIYFCLRLSALLGLWFEDKIYLLGIGEHPQAGTHTMKPYSIL